MLTGFFLANPFFGKGTVSKELGERTEVLSPSSLLFDRHLPVIKGGDPSAGSPTDTLLQLSPPHKIQNRNGNKLPLLI